MLLSCMAGWRVTITCVGFTLGEPLAFGRIQLSSLINVYRFFYKHELLTKYEWYWRVEPEIKYFCDIT